MIRSAQIHRRRGSTSPNHPVKSICHRMHESLSISEKMYPEVISMTLRHEPNLFAITSLFLLFFCLHYTIASHTHPTGYTRCYNSAYVLKTPDSQCISSDPEESAAYQRELTKEVTNESDTQSCSSGHEGISHRGKSFGLDALTVSCLTDDAFGVIQIAHGKTIVSILVVS